MWEKPAMSPIDQMELNSLLLRSLDSRTHENIRLLYEHYATPEIIELGYSLWKTSLLISRLEVHDLALLMDLTGNLDAPLP